MKRISSRAIIIENDYVYLFFRKRLVNNEYKEYYSIPGGGKEENESLEDTVIRELKEELSVDIRIKGYLGFDENETSVAHFFDCEIINGKPVLGGEEKERNCPENYYEIRRIHINELDNINLINKNVILRAYNKQYIDR